MAAVLAVLAVLAVALSGAARAAEPVTPASTMATVVADQEPLCLNILRTQCNTTWAVWTAGVALPGAFRIAPGFALEPMLVERVDVERDPFALTYHLRAEAEWSDGVPVSADDLIFTHGVIVTPAYGIASRAGHELVVSATKLGPKTARFVFSEPFGAWRTLFRAILPKHVLEGRNFDQVWQTQIVDPATDDPIGSGPFLVTSWTPGQSITLSRNPNWWGPHAPYLDTITFPFIPDVNSAVQAMLAGTADVFAPQPVAQIADLRADPALVVETAPGTALEHVTVNAASEPMPLLDEAWFRRALAHALDRPPLFPAAYGSISPDLGVAQSLIHPLGHVDYQPSFAGYAFDVSAVGQLMSANGCTLGGDSVWSCGGVRASLELATLEGNQVRKTVVEELSVRAAAAGFELVPDYFPTNELVTRLENGQFESLLFAWIKSADSVLGSRALYGCDGTQNYGDYCSPEVTDLLEQAEAEVDPAARAALGNAADDLLAADPPAIPLFARPAFLVSRATLQGPGINPSQAGPTWNVADWFHGSFADVPPSNPFFTHIEQLLTEGITTGCGTNAVGRRLYCPADSVPRQQMAAFLIRAKGLTQLLSPTPTFADVPPSNPFYGYIERLYEQGITTGCGTNSSGQLMYCPEQFVPRQQMAAFLIRAKGLTQLLSPTPTFADVPTSNPFYGWIERLYEQGITTGCGTNSSGGRLYCPGDNVPRQQMAAFLIRAFG